MSSVPQGSTTGSQRMELRIREARQTDAEALTGIWNEIIEAGAYSALDTRLTVEYEREYIVSFSPRGVFLVAERPEDHRVLGFQCIEPFATYTHAFDHVGVVGTCIELALRRQGIGKRLSGASFEEAREKGYEKLFTYVRADNDGALGFYKKLGFRVVGAARKHVKIKGRYVDSMFLEMFLSPLQER